MPVQLVSPIGEVLEFDAVPRIGWGPSNRVTKHPIEDGSVTNDHIQGESLRIALAGVISSSPWLNSPNALRLDPVGDAVAWLERNRYSLLTLITPRDGTHVNLALTSWPHETRIIRGKVFEIELVQMRIATIGYVTIPPEAPAAGVASQVASATDSGPQATQSVSVTTGAGASGASILSQLSGVLGG